MGRIKTKPVKRVTQELVDKHNEDFSTDFTKNKEAVTKYADIKSKKIRNTIAGYVTKLMKTRD